MAGAIGAPQAEAPWAAAEQAYRQGRYAEAENLYRQQLAAAPTDLQQAALYQRLGRVYRVQGRYAEAERSYRQSLALYLTKHEAEPLAIAAVHNDLGRLYQDQGRYREAERYYRQALEAREHTQGVTPAELADSLNDLASLRWERGQYEEAEALMQRALTLRETALGAQDPAVAQSCNNLGLLFWNQGRYREAEPLLQRGLAIRETALGVTHPDVATSLNNLALLFYSQHRYAEAEPLYQRALAIREQAFGAQHPIVGLSLNNLARLYGDQGRFAEAEPLYRRSLAIREAALGPQHPDIATTLNSLGLLYAAQARYREAEALYRRALQIREQAFGPDHPYVAHVLNNLAQLKVVLGQTRAAERLYRRALTIREAALGAEHPDLAVLWDNLAQLYARQGRVALAVRTANRGVAILRQRYTQAAEADAGQWEEQKAQRAVFTRQIALLQRARHAAGAAAAFESAQLAQASSVGQTVAQMAARFAQPGNVLARAIRERQDTAEQLARADKALIESVGLPPQRQDAQQLARLRTTLQTLRAQLAQESKALSLRFPAYDNLVSAAPVGLAEAQKLLRPAEALVLYLVDAQGSFVWVVRPKQIAFQRLALTPLELDRQIRVLRARLDPQQNPDLDPYDVAAAHQLYRKIFAPIAAALRGVRHVIQINDGALQSLPFAVLVGQATPPGATPDWLGEHFAFSVVPSVSALRALREFRHAAPARDGFIGFGNPLLQGAQGAQRRLGARALFADAHTQLGSGIADVDAIRQASPLPETALELKALAATLHAPESSVLLQQDAREQTVKTLDLARYRVLAFATHGVMAGELRGVAEPGLILTPPAQGSALDDGYLSASEVAQLQLNADWVLLSACNTAAPDGAPGAEGFSGLAKGFFYAGARALLVSHWYVVSDAAVRITTEMLQEYADHPAQGKARALQLSMHKLRTNPRFAHPLFWAPFVVVGEGG